MPTSKHIAATLLLLLAMTTLLSAQQTGLSTQEEPVRERNTRPRGGIVGAGISFIPTWHFINTGDLNTELAAEGYPTLAEDGMLMPGVQGYAYIIVIPNLRVGVQWYGGSMENRLTHIDRTIGYYASKLNSSVGGLLLEYVFPFRRFHIAVGGLVGWGNYTLTLTGGLNHFEYHSWTGINYGSWQHKLTNNFFAYQPALTAEYDLHPFVVLSLTGGYYGTSGNEWELNDYFPVQDMPDFKFDAPFVRLGLTVGLFLGEW